MDREAKKEAEGHMVGVTKTTEKTTAVKKNTKTATAAKPVKESPEAKPAPKTTEVAAAPSQSSTTNTVPPQTVRRRGLLQGAARGAALARSPRSRARLTARRGRRSAARGGSSRSPGRDVEIASPRRPFRSKQTAQRGGGIPAYGGHGRSEPYNVDKDGDEPLERLGPVVGYYDLEYADVTKKCPDLRGDDFFLWFELDPRDDSLWGSFYLDPHSGGVLHLNVQPYGSSREPLGFTWRGPVHGQIFCGDSNFGSITFLGGGRIKGKISALDFHFSGRLDEDFVPACPGGIPWNDIVTDWDSCSTEQEFEAQNRTYGRGAYSRS